VLCRIVYPGSHPVISPRRQTSGPGRAPSTISSEYDDDADGFLFISSLSAKSQLVLWLVLSVEVCTPVRWRS
jgi:hypothetical protein